MPELKNGIGGTMSAITLMVLVLLLACGVGLWLYSPPRIASLLSSTLSTSGGSVEVQTLDTITWKEAQNEMKLDPGARVRTGTDSYAVLTFTEDAVTRLDPGTDLLVARLEGNQGNPPDVISLRQWSGRTWNQVPQFLDGEPRFEIQTPSASAMGNGSLFSVNVDESGRTVVRAAGGNVDVRAQGRTVPVPAGQQTEIYPGAPPSAPVPVPPADLESVNPAARAETVRAQAPATTKPTASQSGGISEWTLPPLNEWAVGHWVAVALLMILLSAVFATLSRWR